MAKKNPLHWKPSENTDSKTLCRLYSFSCLMAHHIHLSVYWVLLFSTFSFQKIFWGGDFCLLLDTYSRDKWKKSRRMTCRNGCGLCCWGNICHTFCTVTTWTLFSFFQLAAKLYARCILMANAVVRKFSLKTKYGIKVEAPVYFTPHHSAWHCSK